MNGAESFGGKRVQDSRALPCPEGIVARGIIYYAADVLSPASVDLAPDSPRSSVVSRVVRYHRYLNSTLVTSLVENTARL